MSDEYRESVILGALLHDIGKFAQRAGEKLDGKGKEDSEIFCPKNKYGKPTHYHVVYSENYIKNHLGGYWRQASEFALRHHYPSERVDKIIQLADWLSCGERRVRDIDEDIKEVNKEPLINIFSQLVIDNNIKPEYCPVKSLNNTLEGLFPVSTKEEALSGNPDSENSFDYQWKMFCKESGSINRDNPKFDILFSRILYLLEKYTLFIPSSAYKDKPEVSLFHHLKSTAAIATCLYDLEVNEEKIDKITIAIRNESYDDIIISNREFLFVSGDISGIQDFIYSVTSEHALKGLRGRSFYLQILGEVIARSILDRFNLPLCNLLFCGGGNFTLLLPNLPNMQNEIAEIHKSINHNISATHHGRLGLVISYLPVSYKDFQLEYFGNVWKRLGKLLARDKKRKFHNIIDCRFFEEYGIGGETKGCEICGKEIETDDMDKCELCKSFEDLSNAIKNAKYMVIEKGDQTANISREYCHWNELLKSFGYKVNFSSKEITGKSKIKLNDTKFLVEKDDLCAGYRFEAFHGPEGTLEDIAKKSNGGLKKWGALRMDIDNLSKIFDEGLKYKTISRMNMLSHLISLFFAIRVKHVIEGPYYKEKCIIIYSGGDDLFVIGAWSELPGIAKKIYNDFREFTCERITLSGGIYLAPSDKFPVYQTALESGDAEHKAKSCEGKNRITFFDTPLKWEELEELEAIKDKIVKLLDDEDSDKRMSRSLLTMLYSGCHERELVKSKLIPMVRIWRLLYGLRRLVNRHFKDKGEQIKRIMELQDYFIKDNNLKENLNIAVRWAEYITRTEIKEEQDAKQ